MIIGSLRFDPPLLLLNQNHLLKMTIATSQFATNTTELIASESHKTLTCCQAKLAQSLEKTVPCSLNPRACQESFARERRWKLAASR